MPEFLQCGSIRITSLKIITQLANVCTMVMIFLTSVSDSIIIAAWEEFNCQYCAEMCKDAQMTANLSLYDGREEEKCRRAIAVWNVLVKC